MDKTADENANKIQKICDLLRKETIEPAKQEAREIVENAHLSAKQIIEEANQEKQRIEKQTHDELEKKKAAFIASLQVSSRQAVEQLKQSIQAELFTNHIKEKVAKATQDPQLVAEIINSLVEAIRNDGIDSDLELVLSKNLTKEKIEKWLTSSVNEQLDKKQVALADIAGGAKIKMVDNNITLDMSDEAISSLLINYLREDFRKLIFAK